LFALFVFASALTVISFIYLFIHLFILLQDGCDGLDSENEPLEKQSRRSGQQSVKRDSKANNASTSKSTEVDSQDSNPESGAESTSTEKDVCKDSGVSASKSIPTRLKSIITRNKFKDLVSKCHFVFSYLCKCEFF